MAATAVLAGGWAPLTAATELNPKAPEFQMPHHAFNANAPEFKPVEKILRPEAAEFIPMAGGWATLAAATEAYQNKQKRAMPFATDEEWEQRISKREKEVETIKSLQSYRLYIEVFPADQRGEDDPKTPDARDRTVSKRMWKWNVEKWRLQLKSRCVYSRNILLQCREALASTAVPQAPAQASDGEVQVHEAGAVEQASNMNVRAETADRLQAVHLPEPSRGSASGSRRNAGATGEAASPDPADKTKVRKALFH
jgi:hypothetical protein